MSKIEFSLYLPDIVFMEDEIFGQNEKFGCLWLSLFDMLIVNQLAVCLGK